MSNCSSKVIVALDYSDAKSVLAFVDKLEPSLCKLKVGKELFISEGPPIVLDLIRRGFDVFLDLKFHDIPNTVAKAVAVAADMGVWMTNVHIFGGRRMMEAAKEEIDRKGSKIILIGVTVLTSIERRDLRELGMQENIMDQVRTLSCAAEISGLDGVVCSAREVPMLRNERKENFILVTPGIRLSNSPSDDQRRVVTPIDAIQNGSDFIVIGRPVTQSASPADTIREIVQSIL